MLTPLKVYRRRVSHEDTHERRNIDLNFSCRYILSGQISAWKKIYEDTWPGLRHALPPPRSFRPAASCFWGALGIWKITCKGKIYGNRFLQLTQKIIIQVNCGWATWQMITNYSWLSRNGHLYKTDTWVKQTPREELVPAFLYSLYLTLCWNL